MIMTNDIDRSTATIARRTLLMLLVLTTLGYLVGVLAIFEGTVSGAEIGLIVAGLVFNSGVIALQISSRRIPFQSYATLSTAFMH